MDVRLDTFTRKGTFTKLVVHSLIEWTEREWRVQELINMAHADTPGNPQAGVHFLKLVEL